MNAQTNIVHAGQVNIHSSFKASVLPVPQQIPQHPKDFTGRDEEIKDLLDQFGKGATITGLRGMGGVGKTALALVLADRLKDRFPDGRLYLEMQGTSKNPLKSEEAMAHIIRSYLGLDVKLPADQNGLGGLYQSVLSGKKALILLDNAVGRAQVEPFLPPKGCALLVTSRNKFALHGLIDMDLDVLPLEDAKKPLLSICGRIGEHAGDLAVLCGCLPIALRNAAYALKEKSNISVASYMKKLGDARKRLELVEASFSSSYDLLTPELQRLWSLLSVFPADFDLSGAAAVWEMESDSTEEALGELVKWSLVDFMPSAKDEGGRYKLHDLARDFAGSRLDHTVSGLALQRHSEHYMNVLAIADEIFSGKENFREGLLLFDLEKRNILAGQSWAEDSMAINTSAMELCKAYPDVGLAILNLRLPPQHDIAWSKAGLEAAKRLEDRTLEGNYLWDLGIAYYNIGESHKAIEYCEQALSISHEIAYKQGVVCVLADLSSIYYSLGETRKAREYYEQANRANREMKDCNEITLGKSYDNLGEPRDTIEYYERALKISRDIGDRRRENRFLGKLGDVYSDLGFAYPGLGDRHKAIEYYKQALKISREIGDLLSEECYLIKMYDLYFDLGEPRKVIGYYEEALKISREISNRMSEEIYLGDLAFVYSSIGEPRKAIEYYEQALKISREISSRRQECVYLSKLGRAYSDLDEPQKAIEYYEQALKISREISDRRQEGDILYHMINLLYLCNQKAKAIKLSREALAIFEQIESRPDTNAVKEQIKKWLE